MSSSEATTHGIRIAVRAEYVPDRSDPGEGRWFFAYFVTIENVAAPVVQLVSRRWVITDAHGTQEVVEGPGVVGRQPILGPGESHRYTSFCPLGTPFGTMEGSFRMVPQDGRPPFDAEIAPFTLAEPFSVN
jgi:ApaG protein